MQFLYRFLKFDRKLALLFLGRLGQVVFAVLSFRLMTELLRQNEIGQQYLIWSVIVWFNLVMINPVTMFVNRHLHEWKAKGELYRFMRQMNRYFLFTAMLSVPIIILVQYFVQPDSKLSVSSTLVLICSYIYFGTWFITLNSFFNLFEVQRVFILLNVFSQFLGLVFAAFFVTTFSPTAVNWLGGLLLGQIVALAGALALFHQKFPRASYDKVSQADSLFTKSTLQFCYPIAVATLFMWFMNQGYRIFVERSLGTEYLASLGVGLGLAISLAGVIETITTQYFYPQFYSRLPNTSLAERTVAWFDVFKSTTIIYLPAAFLIAAVSPLVIRLLTSPDFRHVGLFVLFGAAIEVLRQMANIAYLVPHAEKKTIYTIIPYGVGAFVLGTALIVLSRQQELNTQSILCSLLLSGIVTYVSAMIIVKRLIGVKFGMTSFIKPLMASLPLLLPAFLLSSEDSLILLLGTAVVSAGWFFAVVIYLLKNKK